MKILGYLGLLAAVVILCILFVVVAKSVMGAGGVETGSQKAARELSEPGEEMDPQSEIRGTVQDAMGN
jgi:hypothetical protein